MSKYETAQDILNRITSRDRQEAEERTNRALKPLRDDALLGESAELSFCDNCGDERKCKLLPIGGGGNVILCRHCYNKEMNWRRESKARYSMTEAEREADTPAWYTLKWYNLP